MSVFKASGQGISRNTYNCSVDSDSASKKIMPLWK